MDDTFKKVKQLVAAECTNAISQIDDAQSEAFINAVQDAEKVFFVGVGRVMLSLESMCKRLAHLGIAAHCVGDINEPAITQADLLVVGSGSGESLIPVAIAKKAKQIGAKIAWIGSNDESTAASLADYKVRIPVQSKLNKEDEIKSEQPMTSLFEQTLLLYGDAIALTICKRKHLDLDGLWKYHANLE